MRIRPTLGLCTLILALSGCAAHDADPVAADVEWARTVRPLVHDRALLAQQRAFREIASDEFSLQLNRAEESKIPYNALMRYPANWPEIVELRDRETREQSTIAQ
jgi:hypothetical protein